MSVNNILRPENISAIVLLDMGVGSGSTKEMEQKGTLLGRNISRHPPRLKIVALVNLSANEFFSLLHSPSIAGMITHDRKMIIRPEVLNDHKINSCHIENEQGVHFDQENIQMLHDNENAVFNHCLLALEKEEKQLHEKELKTHEKDHKNHQGQPLQRAARYTTSPFSKNQTTKLILGQQLLRTKQRLAERKQEEVKKEEEEEKRKHAIDRKERFIKDDTLKSEYQKSTIKTDQIEHEEE